MISYFSSLFFVSIIQCSLVAPSLTSPSHTFPYLPLPYLPLPSPPLPYLPLLPPPFTSPSLTSPSLTSPSLTSPSLTSPSPSLCHSLHMCRLLAVGPNKLLLAAMTGDHHEIVRLVEEEGLNPIHTHHLGLTALHEASGAGHIEACRTLLALGADVHKQVQTCTDWQLTSVYYNALPVHYYCLLAIAVVHFIFFSYYVCCICWSSLTIFTLYAFLCSHASIDITSPYQRVCVCVVRACFSDEC